MIKSLVVAASALALCCPLLAPSVQAATPAPQAATPAAQGTLPDVINIKLQDSSSDPSLSGMVIKIDNAKVKAGRVKMFVVNESKKFVHDVTIALAPPAGKELPYDTKRDIVDEKLLKRFGEIDELRPGRRGNATLTLAPGTYILFCNEPGHYKADASVTKLVVEE